MSIFMLLTILFGVKYTNDSIAYISRANKNIKENSQTTINLSESMNQFNLVDNLILSKSLKGEDITNNMEVYTSYVDSFMLNKYEYKKVDSLLQIKKRLLYNIYLSKKKSDIVETTKVPVKREESEMQEAIYYNNSLSYQIRHLLNFKISIINSRNIKSQSDLGKELEDRFLKYVTVMFSLMFVFLITGLLLYIDIRKKSKSDERRKNFISLLLNRKYSL
jgi:hypothetical protein